MLVVDSSPLYNMNTLNDDSTLIAAASFAFANATKIVTVTDSSTIPAGQNFKAMVVDIYDKNGTVKSANIAAAAGNVAIDLDAAPSLDLTGPVTIKTRLVTDKFSKTGAAYGVAINNGADIAATAIQFEK